MTLTGGGIGAILVQLFDHPIGNPGRRSKAHGPQDMDCLFQGLQQAMATVAFIDVAPEATPIFRAELTIDLVGHM